MGLNFSGSASGVSGHAESLAVDYSGGLCEQTKPTIHYACKKLLWGLGKDYNTVKTVS